MVHIELPIMLACALQEFAYSAIWVGLGSGFGVEVSWSLCIVDGDEEVIRGGLPSACVLAY